MNVFDFALNARMVVKFNLCTFTDGKMKASVSYKSKSRRKRGCFLTSLAAVFAFSLLAWFFYPRLAAFIPYPEWMPVRSESNHTFGIDVSHYQGHIKWNEVKKSHHPIEFVFVRATMGKDGIDEQFERNWEEVKRVAYIRGAYHYYRPNENSSEQFENFKNQVTLESGDLPPVLDVEAMSSLGRDNLRKGVKNWIALCEQHYGQKPIVYTGRTFYLHNLVGAVDDCPLWIAAYSGKHRVKDLNWTFHQFTERVRVRGIRGTVDGNDFNGKREDLLQITRP